MMFQFLANLLQTFEPTMSSRSFPACSLIVPAPSSWVGSLDIPSSPMFSLFPDWSDWYRLTTPHLIHITTKFWAVLHVSLLHIATYWYKPPSSCCKWRSWRLWSCESIWCSARSASVSHESVQMQHLHTPPTSQHDVLCLMIFVHICATCATLQGHNDAPPKTKCLWVSLRHSGRMCPSDGAPIGLRVFVLF